jgi:peptide/nickel transport system substrate-binding protein
MTRRPIAAALVLGLVATSACLRRPTDDPNVIVVGVQAGPNTLDPRIATDDVAQRVGQLVFSSLMTFDDSLRVVPELAERLENPTPTTYVVTLRRGVLFHDGHELTSADVVYTYRSLLAPDFVSPLKGAFQLLESVVALDRYTVRFTLSEPFGSFPVNLVSPPIVPENAGADFAAHVVGTGPYRFVRYLTDDRIELAAFDGYFGGTPANSGLVLRVVPDLTMMGLELRKGTLDVVVNDLTPDMVYELQRDDDLQTVEAPGTDFQYVGINLRDPALADIRVRRALGYAIDREAIATYLRRGMARPAAGLLPPVSWAYDPDIFEFTHDPARAAALLEEAGYPDPDGAGPLPRLRLSLKVSTNEASRLQATVIQQDLREAGIDLDVRTYEFATLYADVLAGNFQLYTLQWTGGSLADPDILRRVFHSAQVPPNGFNRGFFSNARVDALIDAASTETDLDRRRELYGQAQAIIADEAPYICLWHRDNAAVARRELSGIHLNPIADFLFLKDVSRTPQTQPIHQ